MNKIEEHDYSFINDIEYFNAKMKGNYDYYEFWHYVQLILYFVLLWRVLEKGSHCNILFCLWCMQHQTVTLKGGRSLLFRKQRNIL